MRTSESIKNIAAALCKAQAKLKAAIKDATNPHLNKKYADLASCWDACRECLTDNGIAVVQANHSDRDESGKLGVYVTTLLLHSSGEFIEETCEIPLPKQDPHGVGMAITYGRRYGLCAMVGIAPEDDDAESAISRNSRGESQEAPPRKARTATKPSDAAVPEHVALARSEYDRFCSFVSSQTDRNIDGVRAEISALIREKYSTPERKIKTLDDLTPAQASKLIDYFEVERESMREPAHA